MTLGTRPYKVFITGKMQDANGAWVATVEVRDSAATPTVRLATSVALSPPEELIERLQTVLLRAYALDLGGPGPLLDALIAGQIPIAQL